MMKKISHLWPARSQKIDDGPVADLDAIIAEPVPFRFKGKIHTLKVIDLEHFLRYTNAQSNLMKAASDQGNPMTAKELAQKYFEVINPLCETISIIDIMSMEQVQIAALYQLITDLVTGQVDLGEGKKKRQKIPIYDIARASSSQNVPVNSGGTQKPV